MKRNVFVLFVLLSFLSFAYSYDFSLDSIKTEENAVSIHRGKSIQTISDENFLISMHAQKVSEGIQFSTSITNFTNQDYFFDEDSIKVYQGIFEENLWNEIEYEPAAQYLKKEKAIAKAAVIASAVAAEITAVNAGYSTVSGSGYSNGHRYYYKAEIYSSADAAIAMANSYIALDNLQQRNSNWLSFLEDNLLFSSNIASKENYNGIFIVDEKKGPDYKIVMEFAPNETFVFYFTRSDKDEILNPWKDKSHSRHSIIAGMNPVQNHYSLYYLWSRPRGAGLYAGFTGRIDGTGIPTIAKVYKDISNPSKYDFSYGFDPNPYDESGCGYQYQFIYDEKSLLYNSIGEFVGMTIKLCPKTWVMCGAGIEYCVERYYQGELYYKFSENTVRNKKIEDNPYIYYGEYWILQNNLDILFTPQIGINFITNHLDIGCIASFPINGKFSIDITAGFAF